MSRYLRLQDRILPLQHPRVLIELAESQGAGREDVLARSGLSEEMLRDPDARISYAEFGVLTTNALRLTGNAALGIDFGLRIEVTSLGMVALAMASSGTVGDRLRTHLRFGAIYAPAWDAKLRVQGPVATITAVSMLPFGDLRPFAAESLLAAIIRTALGAETQVRELRLDYPAPVYADRYAQIAPVASHFEQPKLQLVFDAEALARPLPAFDPLTHELALRACEADLAELPIRKRLVGELRELLARSPGKYDDHQAAAKALGLNARGLRRALSELGTTYQSLLDEQRREHVLRYLRESRVTLEQAAEELGFSDVRSLRRSVRRWTGMSLQELRAKLRTE